MPQASIVWASSALRMGTPREKGPSSPYQATYLGVMKGAVQLNTECGHFSKWMSLGSPHVRPMRRTCGARPPNEIELRHRHQAFLPTLNGVPATYTALELTPTAWSTSRRRTPVHCAHPTPPMAHQSACWYAGSMPLPQLLAHSST